MAVYIVTWNINLERANYAQARDAFVAHLESTYQFKKDSGLETVRFIQTQSSASQVDAHLRQKLDANDRLFVSKLNNGEHQGWLNKEVWEWINARL